MGSIMLVWLGLASLMAAVVLALHHWYIHKDNVAEDMMGNPCLLQAKDFCLFTRGTHKTPILFLAVLGVVLLAAAGFGLG